MIRNDVAAWLENDPIVVTGMGCLAAGARSPAELYAATLAGRSTAVWTGFDRPGGEPERFAACLAPDPDLAPAAMRVVRRMDRAARLGYEAARSAWLDAGLDGSGIAAERVGLVVEMFGRISAESARANPTRHRGDDPVKRLPVDVLEDILREDEVEGVRGAIERRRHHLHRAATDPVASRDGVPATIRQAPGARLGRRTHVVPATWPLAPDHSA